MSCYKRIRVYYVQFANIITNIINEEYIEPDNDFCTKCGRCVKHCEHETRGFVKGF
ncbi:4Fe-4S binding protein [Caldicellulosiruptor saccharolyticus]|uniref:4Fe-4S binding protein n=1 Tax=Caldicellulosiruptor saccharolyticus TaxID=44001 RepID=UPI0011D0DC9A